MMHDGPIWITGMAGFIGGRLAHRLQSKGHRVVGFGRTGTASLLSLSADGFAAALAQHGTPAKVYHLAGGSTVGHSFADPVADFGSNVVSTVQVLDILRHAAPEAQLVIASSAAVYGAGHDGPVCTDAALVPESPYGHHKRMAELAAEAHVAAFGLRATVVRLFSVYGPGLRKQLLHDICHRLAAGETPLHLGGTGEELRDWIHVDDVCDALDCLPALPAGRLDYYNLGTGRPTSVHTMAATLIARLGLSVAVQFSGIRRSGDPFCLLADPRSLPPDFLPRIALDTGLAEVAAYAQSNLITGSK